jgi:hypothetical protein
MDRDGDGAISAEERKAALDRFADQVRGGFHLEIDGKRIRPEWPERYIGLGRDQVGALPFAVDLIESFPLEGDGEHRIVIDDGTRFLKEGETEIQFLEAGVSLVRADVGAGRRLRRNFKFYGRPGTVERRAVTALFRGPPPAAGEEGGVGGAPLWALVALGAGLVALLGLGAVVLVGRARRRRAG